MVLTDLDEFKRLNDTRGHEAGDQALRLFAETLRASLREGDLAARWGGEEFVLILPQSNAAKAQEVAERIRAMLAEKLLVGAIPHFTASFGIADTSMGTRFEQLLRMADEALYRAKESGRDCVRVAGGQPTASPARRRAFEHPAAPDLDLIAHAE